MTRNAELDLVGSPCLIGLGTKDLRIGTSGAGALRLCQNGLFGCDFKVATATIEGAAAATITSSNLIPAGAIVLGVTIRITETFSNASLTALTIGDGTDADRWGASIALTAGTQTTSANFTAGGAIHYASATSVVLTGTGANFAANGEAEIRVFYLTVPGL